MKIQLGFSDQDQSKDDGFRIEERGNCKIVHGSLPMSEMSKIAKGAPKGAMMSTNLSRLARATIVFGMPDDLKRLEEEILPESIALARVEYAGHALSEEAITWLGGPHVGSSSAAIFSKLTGVAVMGFGSDGKSHPFDIYDFIRCQNLLDQVPELKDAFSTMREVSPTWEKLVDNWDAIFANLSNNNPDWKDYKAPNTEANQMLKEITSPKSPKP